MKTIDGRSGSFTARTPGRSATWVTKPLPGARTTVLSRSNLAMFSCACRSSTRAVVRSTSRRLPTLRAASSRARDWSARADISCAWMDFTRFSNGVGSMRNSTSPLFSGWLALTGTSMTWPDTSGTMGTEVK
ncbi:hypothetical protein D3C84_856710 [compost metagenome]